MGFWIFMTCCTLLIPVIMVCTGAALRRGKFSTINPVSGYRTRRSMQNQQTWDYAQRECGRLWVRWGVLMLVPAAVIMLLLLGKEVPTIGTVGGIFTVLQMLPLLLSIAIIEKKLRRTFDENGTPRQ